MRLSLVIPVIDEATNLQALLLSLQALRQKGHEIIVVDGGSRDNSVSIAKELADSCIPSISGRARQMNVGASQAKGDVLLFIHADSRLPVTVDSDTRACIEQGAAWGRFDISINSPSAMLKLVSFMMNIRSAFTGIVTGDQCLFVKRDLFDSLGGYADIPLMEDIELSSRLKKISPPACISNRVCTSARRWKKNGILRTILSMWRNRLRYWAGVSAEILADEYYPDRDATGRNAILVFAKAPLNEQVKTRLAPVLSASQRTELHKSLVCQTLELARSTGLTVELFTTETENNFIKAVAKQYSVSLHEQQGDNLGQRMQNALADALSRYSNVMLLGTDCPVISEDYIASAFSALSKHNIDVVFGPAEDGGYVLLATRRYIKPLFENISWGGSDVYSQSRQRLDKAMIAHYSLACLWDVDRPDDYQRYCELVNSRPDGQEVAASA